LVKNFIELLTDGFNFREGLPIAHQHNLSPQRLVKLYKESLGGSSLLTVIMMPLSKWEEQSGEPHFIGRICQNQREKFSGYLY
jgi:hypothetical protein